MVRTPAELRMEARLYTEAADREGNADMKRRLARHAFALAQGAEQLEREQFVIKANIERYEHMLTSALDDGPRKRIDALLGEERAKLAALAPEGWHSHVTAQFDYLLEVAIAGLGADMGTVQALDPSTGCLRIVASRGFDAPFLDFFAIVPDGDHCACGTALKQGNRIVVPDVERSAIFVAQQSGDALREAGARSVQSTPLVGRAGNMVGMISTHRRHVWEPGDDGLKQLDTMIDDVMRDIEA